MSITSLAGTVHKWLALVLLLPILFWFGSGLFFALSPIEQVRSEHLMARQPVQSMAVATAASGLKRLADRGIGSADRIELRMLLGKPVALVSHGKDRPKLFDLTSVVQINPVSSATATAIARQDYRGAFAVDRVVAITQNSPEYRGALPAWEVRLKGDTGLSIYVAADTGLVTARRSDLWRAYDFLWGLHILDIKEHENFNSWLLVLAVGSSLILLVSGIVLIPERLGWIARWRRTKRA
ncbi:MULTISPECIES: PepSY domain-containing protein [unclassified Sphingomonas]|uniref:PepSY domain-containing protein n=1 Tax=unclassified Sphingomonas TaxID=196159 RepID=UPI000BCF01A9|nr:MAG: hypothetical protein B7Z43_06785 [Sphingomonas sp. 12-62-6]OYX39457.1 MAG: hypothetical protein B7Y98_05975 [Sphingomonas sp. 32-62-10]